jgi:lipopolysaccharide biosynthesis protein
MTTAPGRAAVLAHWAPDRRLSRSVRELTRALLERDYQVVLVSTAEAPEPLEWSGPQPGHVTVLRRPNIGYDFGSWATALARYPQVASADHVLLLNDSLVGPFAPLDDLLARFEASPADVWGITDTSQFGHHLQSYCMGFRGRCLQEAELRRFWRSIRVEPSKDDVIWRDEIGLSRLLHQERFVVEAAIPYRLVVGDGQNPTIVGWRRLLDRGFPFVKRELLRWPELVPDGALVRPELRRRYDVEADEWV